MHVPSIVAAFDLGSSGRLSDGPVASGRVGSIWRLDTERASWAVKQVGDLPEEDIVDLLEGAAFQEAAVGAGVPAPAPRRTPAGELIADCGGVRVRLHSWVDLHDPDASLDPLDLGRLAAGLHRVDFAGTIGLDPWYTEPVGAARWSELVSALRARHAPFADELDALVPELVAMGAYLGGPPRELRTCHRDLWADNVRTSHDGGLYRSRPSTSSGLAGRSPGTRCRRHGFSAPTTACRSGKRLLRGRHRRHRSVRLQRAATFSPEHEARRNHSVFAREDTFASPATASLNVTTCRM